MIPVSPLAQLCEGRCAEPVAAKFADDDDVVQFNRRAGSPWAAIDGRVPEKERDRGKPSLKPCYSLRQRAVRPGKVLMERCPQHSHVPEVCRLAGCLAEIKDSGGDPPLGVSIATERAEAFLKEDAALQPATERLELRMLAEYVLGFQAGEGVFEI